MEVEEEVVEVGQAVEMVMVMVMAMGMEVAQVMGLVVG